MWQILKEGLEAEFYDYEIYEFLTILSLTVKKINLRYFPTKLINLTKPLTTNELQKFSFYAVFSPY